MSKFISYSLTLRPRGGITEDDLNLLKKITVKYCLYWFIITEKEDESRHIHAALYLKKETTVSAFNQMMKRVFEGTFLERESIWGVAYKAKPMYNDDFVSKYMTKGDKTVEVDSHIPDLVERCSYYRDIPTKKVGKQTGDPYFAKLEKLYFEYCPKGKLAPSTEPTLQEMESFMCRMMFKERRIRVITDSRKMRRTCKCLRQYIMKAICYAWRQGDVTSESLWAGSEPIGYGQG